MTDLAKDLRRLKGEVENLEVRRLYTSLGVPTKQSVWNIATEYFRLFQCGVVPGAHLDFALTFLKKTMSPDVTDGTVHGPGSLVENWRLLSLYFDGINVRLNRLVEAGAHSVVAITTTSINISPDTLQQVFSHLNGQDKGVDEDEKTSLATKLIGQTLVVRGSVRFDWDSKSERVVAVYSQSDLQTPLLHLLGSLEDVVRVLDGALVTAELQPRT